AFCLSVFSERMADRPEEVCLIVDSHRLCLVVYAQQARAPAQNIFKCAGSMEPQIVHQAVAQMLPFFQYADANEANRLEDARTNLGQGASDPSLVQYCKSLWPASQPAAAPSPAVQPIVAPAAGAVAPSAAVPPPAGQHAGIHVDLFSGQQIPLAMPPPPTPPGAAAASPDSSQPSGRRAGRKTQGRLGELSYPAGVPPGAAVPPAGPAAVPQPAQRHVIPPAAQEIVKDIVEGMRHSSDLNVILQLAIEKLTTVGQAHRGLIWQVVGDQMTATNEFSVSGNTP